MCRCDVPCPCSWAQPPSDDYCEAILVKGLDHMIVHPQAIHVDESNGRLDSIEVVREDGTYEVVEFL